ncbi:MAG: class I SAM-dependent methyltransferase [Bdellovibrionota bacterium]
MHIKIESCRVCGNKNLETVLHLGDQQLTGVFPSSPQEQVTVGPLELVKCIESSDKSCGLLQLRHNFSLTEMYGDNYGYRSGLNSTMVKHLAQKIDYLKKYIELQEGDLVVDIGSNDATLLSMHDKKAVRIGIDPTAKKFKSFYSSDMIILDNFFSASLFENKFSGQKAKLITSIAMFYDLEAPLGFASDIAKILHPEGLWLFEQSYMPRMVEMNAYDTVCHEHLEYYGIRQVEWIVKRAELKIIDCTFNGANGGSFAVLCAHVANKRFDEMSNLKDIVRAELDAGYNTIKPYQDFEKRVKDQKIKLQKIIRDLKSAGKTVAGYGASTKGNVVLQYCGFSSDEIYFISEVNKDKYGKFTPGTGIPIISEAEAVKKNPDYYLVLPWHFRDGIIKKEMEYLKNGGQLIFPMPEIEFVSYDSLQSSSATKFYD